MAGMIRLPDPDRIGAAIADLRVLHGLRQRDLAQLASIWQSRLSVWESGTNRPDIGQLVKVANALGYDLALIPREDT